MRIERLRTLYFFRCIDETQMRRKNIVWSCRFIPSKGKCGRIQSVHHRGPQARRIGVGKNEKDNESNEKDSTDKRTDYPDTGDLHHIGIRILLYDAEPCVHQQYRRIGDCTGELRPAVGIHDHHHHQRIPADYRFHHLRTGVRLQDHIHRC